MSDSQKTLHLESDFLEECVPALKAKDVLWELQAIYYLNQSAILSAEERITASLQKLVVGTSVLTFLALSAILIALLRMT